eukprot:CAMPEP_0194328160 /NCGR_PEP_ID=MMETSP0171-20130528/43751_1 /TAXON_ID=218684 /ORGANISM="Corethron pennatum, Strain L29A3" /LENGTH=283 /DNA_ID=CAMNT_0039088399 /DNA_START=39 /DNA_END=887 /DNA_ORIENTATION=-
MAAAAPVTTADTGAGVVAKTNIKPKRVIVHTFHPVPHVYSISPFGIKVESFLRLRGIPYETVHTSKFGPKGKIPYVHLIGGDGAVEVVPDSNVIVGRLEEEFGGSGGDGGRRQELSPEESAVSHALVRMLEEHTAQIGFYYRYSLRMSELMRALNLRESMSPVGRTFFVWIMPAVMRMRTAARGLSCHSDCELARFCCDDLRALSDYLGDKKYLFGHAATAADCAAFGHLAQFLYVPIRGYPPAEFLRAECPNLVRYAERFRSEFWGDWEDKCGRQADAGEGG